MPVLQLSTTKTFNVSFRNLCRKKFGRYFHIAEAKYTFTFFKLNIPLSFFLSIGTQLSIDILAKIGKVFHSCLEFKMRSPDLISFPSETCCSFFVLRPVLCAKNKFQEMTSNNRLHEVPRITDRYSLIAS